MVFRPSHRIRRLIVLIKPISILAGKLSREHNGSARKSSRLVGWLNDSVFLIESKVAKTITMALFELLLALLLEYKNTSLAP